MMVVLRFRHPLPLPASSLPARETAGGAQSSPASSLTAER